MHNKLYIVDNQAAVVGGRNVGDEYFGVGGTVDFADLDVLAAGAVVGEASASFDAYWNSASAYPVGSVLPAVAAADASAAATARALALANDPKASAYLEALKADRVLPDLLAGTLQAEWTAASLHADDPGEVVRPSEDDRDQLLPRLQAALGVSQQELLLVSPYFVPTRQGTSALAAIAARGVRVSVLTNSLASTDVAATYAGYARYRRDLLRAGVRLYELKPSRVPAKGDSSDRPGVGGSSGASLHAKVFAVDRRRIYVGSFNLDPRSARLNTESGVVVESASLSASLSDAFVHEIPQRAYEVRLDETGQHVVWIERTAAGEVRHPHAPAAGLLRRISARLMGWLPIEWLL